ncbi:MAG TPA: TetR/AcrR family transcriptional regulator, partial [Acidimicrobiales bacterium]|nr:TetR/AcrR family transcriptional regulator [Acidimicrobiales bacterium]
GYKGTSITAIEKAAGLAQGAGGIYHHFPSKHALLEAGIARHLSRLDALRDIRRILVDLGDLQAELTVLARYALAEIDHETDLLRIVLAEARNHPDLIGSAVDTLIGATYTSFSGWLRDRTKLDDTQASALATVSLGALFSARLLRLLLGRDPMTIDDDTFIDTWVQMVSSQIP